MKNGTYKYALEMIVPLGKRRGLLELKVSNNRVGGFLTMFTQRLPLETAILSGSELSFTGEMKTLMYPMKYNATGTIDRNALELSFNTDKGVFPATGEVLKGESL